MSDLDELRRKHHSARAQMIDWSRRVNKLEKQIRLEEKRNAVTERDGGGPEGQDMDREPAGG
jgi:hypothetical protein